MADSDELPDSLLQALEQGDELALAEMIRRYEPEIRRVARVRLGPLLRPHIDSVDLVQSVCITLLQGVRRDQFSLASPEQLIALSAEIIRRKVSRLWRRIQRRQRLHDHVPGLRELAQTLVFTHDEPDDPAETVQRRDAVEHVLQQLEPVDQRLLRLRLEGLTTAESAREMNADADVLRVRLSRLRKRLRDQGVLTDWL